MAKTYSTYEAKARLSELLERVRKGEAVTITYRGEPIAELRGVKAPTGNLNRRLDDLRRSGVITPRRSRNTLRPLATKPGAVRRFLKSRE